VGPKDKSTLLQILIFIFHDHQEVTYTRLGLDHIRLKLFVTWKDDRIISHCDWPHHFQDSLRMSILQAAPSWLTYPWVVTHILLSDRSIISNILYWYWISQGYLISLFKSVVTFMFHFIHLYMHEYQACDNRPLLNMLAFYRISRDVV
jgi:hypothetical protein